MRHRSLLLLCLLLPASSTCPLAARLPLRQYNMEHGLVHDRVNRIVRDSRGYLWFCMPGGISQFDGTTFAVPGNRTFGEVTDLLEDPGGHYWVATWGEGVQRLDPDSGDPDGMFTHYPVGDNQNTDRVHKLLRDRAGRIWAGGMHGLFVLDAGAGDVAFRPVPLGPAAGDPGLRRIWALTEDRAGTLWLGTSAGLLGRDPQGRVFRRAVRPGDPRTYVRDLMTDAQGRIWVGHDGGLTVFVPDHGPGGAGSVRFLDAGPRESGADVRLPEAPGETRHLTGRDGIGPGVITSFLVTADGRIWITAYGGALTEFDGASFRTHGRDEGLGQALVSLAEDRDGNLWIGSDVEGAARLARGGFISYGPGEGLQYIVHASIVGTASGEAVIVAGPDAWVLRENRFQRVELNVPAAPSPRVLRDREGEWWIGAERGLYRFGEIERVEDLATAAPWAVYGEPDGLPPGGVTGLCEDGNGDIWISGGGGGLARWKRARGTFEHPEGTRGLTDAGPLTSCANDHGGGVWLCLSSALARFRDGRLTRLTEQDGVPPATLGRLLIDTRGRLWATRTGAGLLRADDPAADRPRFELLTTRDGLTTLSIGPIGEDDRGRIHIGSMVGVDRLDPGTGRVRNYTTSDGLSNNEIDDIYRDTRGAMWVTARRGVSVLPPQPDEPDRPPPGIRIVEVRAGGTRLPATAIGQSRLEGIELTSSRGHVEIRFAGLSFGLGGALRFQFLLEGSDRDWSDPVETRSVHFASLSPGSYRFRVRSVDSEGAVSSRPAEVSFTILPPIWWRWWFLTACGIALAAIAAGVYRSRIAHVVALERIRTRIATDLHDDVGASLSQIALLSDITLARSSGGGDGLQDTLSRIAAESREMVDSMSDIVWAVNPARDRLGDLRKRMRRLASDVLSAREIPFTFACPDSDHLPVGADVRREIYLIFKECLSNTARHSECGRVAIALRLEGDRLELSVADDGQGFVPAGDGGEGHGLSSMKQRAARLGGELVMRSRPGEGTMVRLSVPLDGSRRPPWRRSLQRASSR